MKPPVKKQILFIGRSVLSSLLLYVVMMLVFNWDEVSKTIRGDNALTIVTDTLNGAQSVSDGQVGNTSPNIAQHAGVLRTALAILKEVSSIVVNR